MNKKEWRIKELNTNNRVENRVETSRYISSYFKVILFNWNIRIPYSFAKVASILCYICNICLSFFFKIGNNFMLRSSRDEMREDQFLINGKWNWKASRKRRAKLELSLVKDTHEIENRRYENIHRVWNEFEMMDEGSSRKKSFHFEILNHIYIYAIIKYIFKTKLYAESRLIVRFLRKWNINRTFFIRFQMILYFSRFHYLIYFLDIWKNWSAIIP